MKFLLPYFAIALLSFNQRTIFNPENRATSHTNFQANRFAITGSATPGTVSCNGGLTTVTATASGGTGSITYNISGTTASGGNFTNTSSPQLEGGTYNFTGVPAGTYNVTAWDENAGTAVIGSFTIGQPPSSGTNNGAPDLLLTSIITPSGSFPLPGSSVTFTYTVSNKNTTNIAAQNLILRVTRPFSSFTVELSPASTATWQKITNVTGYVEFMLKPGNQIPCSSTSSLAIIVTRTAGGAQSSGVPITAILYFSSGPQDQNDYDNARASQVRIQ